MDKKGKFVKSKCVIKNCLTSSKLHSNNEITHYSFPSNLITKWRSERRQAWINAVIIHNEWSSNWQPKKHTVICNKHFVGGKKSEHPLHPAYNPTIFPNQKKLQKGCSLEEDLAQLKAKRVKNEIQNPESTQIEIEPLEKDLLSIKKIKLEPPDYSNEYIIPESTFVKVEECDWEKQVKRIKTIEETKDFNCQVNTLISDSEYKTIIYNIMSCDLSRVDKQCHAEIQTSLKQPDIQKKYDPAKNCLQNIEFSGIASINSNNQLLEMCGVTFEVFNTILGALPISPNIANLSKPNKLLICLMKLKQGLSYSALAIIFNLSPKSVFRVFMDMLDTLASISLEYIYWPIKETVQNVLPESIKKEYPNCRAIIDCIEMQIETPKSIEDYASFLKNYENCRSFKVFLAYAPNGFVAHKSHSYGGHKSDSMIANDCGFVDLLEKEDVILADRLYPGLETELKEKNISIVIPKFTNVSDSPVYMHVKQCLNTIRHFKILSFLPLDLLPEMDEVIQVCCYLINMQCAKKVN